MQRAEEGWTKVLGAKHPDTKHAKVGVERIQGKIDEAKADQPGE